MSITKSFEKISITLVAGSRPDLLQRTLESFWEGMLCNFEIKDAHMNLDPIFGDQVERQLCIRIFTSFFPKGRVSLPNSASFGKAVKRVWSQAPSGLVLHVEDDWLLRRSITPQIVENSFGKYGPQLKSLFLASSTTALARENLRWRPNRVHSRLKSALLRSPRYTAFGTSPQIACGSFLQGCAKRMDGSLDPEKQMNADSNPALTEWQKHFLAANLWGPNFEYLITDTGRTWRDERGITKIRDGSKTFWASVGEVERGG